MYDDLKVKKVNGKENIADAFTKYLKREDMERLLSVMEMKLVQGRANASRRLQSMSNGSFSHDETVDQWADLRKAHRHRKKRADSLRTDANMNNTCQIPHAVFKLTSKELIDARTQAEESCRWLRIHNKTRSEYFNPMCLRDGPSSIDHVPNMRLSARFDNEGVKGRIIIDEWKSSESPKGDHKKEVGWTCLLEKLPNILTDKQKIRSSSTSRALAAGG